MPPTVHRFPSTDIAGIRYHGIMEGFIREPCIATFRFIALYVQAGRRSIYQNGTCSIRSEMAAKHPQTSIPPRTNGWSFAKRKKRGWKNHNGRRHRMLRRFPSYCAPTREKCTLIFRNNADERRIFTDRRTKEMYREIFPAVLLDTCILHWLRTPLYPATSRAVYHRRSITHMFIYQIAWIFTRLRVMQYHARPFLDVTARQILYTQFLARNVFYFSFPRQNCREHNLCQP